MYSVTALWCVAVIVNASVADCICGVSQEP